jgi:hypothetical protein
MITCPRCAGSVRRVCHPRLLEKLVLGRIGLHRFYCVHCRNSFYRFSRASTESQNHSQPASEWAFAQRPDFDALIGEIREAEKEWGVGKRNPSGQKRLEGVVEKDSERPESPTRQPVGDAGRR